MGHFSWNIRPVIIVYSHREKYQGEEETIQRQQTVEENSKGGSLYTLSCPLASSGFWWGFPSYHFKVIHDTYLYTWRLITSYSFHCCIGPNFGWNRNSLVKGNLNVYGSICRQMHYSYFFDRIDYDDKERIGHREQHPDINHFNVALHKSRE